MGESKHALPYYGWFVLAAAAVSEMLAQGATSYGAGLFVLPLQAEYGLSRANASSAILIFFIGNIFLSPGAGRILDRAPIRLAVGVGAILFSLALAVIAWTSSLWVMVAALLLPAAMGFSLLGPMMTATLTSRWFFRHRGLALGIAAVATSGGGFTVVPLLSMAIEKQGWRPALLEEAGVFFIVAILLAWLVLRDNPFTSGHGEDPENRGRTDRALMMAGRQQTVREEPLPWFRILGNASFWAPSLMLASVSGIAQVIVVSMPAYGHQLGFTAASSALLISAFSIAAALTKIVSGLMADFWDKRILLFVIALFMPLALGLLNVASGYGAILAACAMAGVALGGALPLSGALIAARFGAARFGSVIGWSYALLALFIILAVRFAGSVFDRSGSYHFAFVCLLLAALLIFAFSLFVDLRIKTRP